MLPFEGMTERKQLGTIPVSALHGRASRSADAACEAQIAADLALTPLERVRKALSLGARARVVPQVKKDAR